MRAILFFIACLLAGACTPRLETIEIPFAVRYGETEIGCNSPDAGPALSDLRLYVHSVRLFDESGAAIDVALTADGIWQSKDIALLDFENGEGACINGSPQTNVVLRGEYSGRAATGLRLEIGVPEGLNHNDPMLAEAPLSFTAMHWHWKSGYKFMRAGLRTPGDDGFWMHLGSDRCEGTIDNILGCRSANRPFVDLPGYRPDASIVVIDLQRLTRDINLADRALSQCQSGPTEKECVAPFSSLGLDFDSGDTVSAATVFRVEAL